MKTTQEDLEEQIEDYFIAKNSVYFGHWLNVYFGNRLDSKLLEYKHSTGIDYDLTKLKKKYKNEILDRQTR